MTQQMSLVDNLGSEHSVWACEQSDVVVFEGRNDNFSKFETIAAMKI
jgi:hypothetical protein